MPETKLRRSLRQKDGPNRGVRNRTVFVAWTRLHVDNYVAVRDANTREYFILFERKLRSPRVLLLYLQLVSPCSYPHAPVRQARYR